MSTASIRALKESMRARAAQLKPHLAAGRVGIGRDGMLVVRNLDGIDLKDQASVRRLVEAENRDRMSLYAEIAKANNFGSERVEDIRKIFAEVWVEKAEGLAVRRRRSCGSIGAAIGRAVGSDGLDLSAPYAHRPGLNTEPEVGPCPYSHLQPLRAGADSVRGRADRILSVSTTRRPISQGTFPEGRRRSPTSIRTRIGCAIRAARGGRTLPRSLGKAFALAGSRLRALRSGRRRGERGVLRQSAGPTIRA